MRRALTLTFALLFPALACAAGTDIVADTIQREADGSITASGNVIISQRSSRQIRDLRLNTVGDNRIAATFTQSLEPAGTSKPEERELVFEKQGKQWRIVADRPPQPAEQPAPVIDTQVAGLVDEWRKAWNRRDLDAYLAFYADDIYPEQEFADRAAWIAVLKDDFAKPPARTIRADRITYHAADQRIEAEGHVRLETAEARLEAASADVDNNTLTGSIHEATLYLPDGQRLQASEIRRISDTKFEAENVRFTACPADEETWAMVAKHATLDQAEGELTARHGRFEVLGVPVLYSPILTQPLRRKSGLLLPQVAVGKRRGTELAIPLYLAPSANWDATYTPHNMTARGFMHEGEFRHVSTTGGEKLSGEVIRDRVTGNLRSRAKGDIHWSLPAGLRFDAQGDHVSDHNYLADYARDATAASRYLQSEASLSQDFRFGDWALSARHQQDMLLVSNASVLQVVPRLESHMFLPLGSDARLHFDQQSTRFTRQVGLDGWRVDLNPYLELPWELDGGGVSANLVVGMHHLRYWFGNIAAGQPKLLDRNSYDTSLELRSDFERISDSKQWRHVISPVIRYDHVWAPDQTGLPNFDSGLAQLTWSNLLSDNRFAGHDRIERSHRVSLLLESLLQSKTDGNARDVLRIRAGVSRNLQRQVTDSGVQTQPLRVLSNILGDMVWSPIAGLSFSASAQYEPYGRYFATTSGGASWSYDGFALGASYQVVDQRYAAASRLLSASGVIPLGQRWQASGQMQYDALLKITQQASVALKYTHPCWAIKVEGYRLNRPSGTSTQADFGASVLLEFKGLGSVGS